MGCLIHIRSWPITLVLKKDAAMSPESSLTMVRLLLEICKYLWILVTPVPADEVRLQPHMQLFSLETSRPRGPRMIALLMRGVVRIE